MDGGFRHASRCILAKAARTRRAGWFKSVTFMEDVARDILGPDLSGGADKGLNAIIESIFAWAADSALG